MGSSGSGAAVLITVEVVELAPSVAVMVALPGVPAKTWTAVLPVLAGMVTVAGTTALGPELVRVTMLSVARVGVIVRAMDSDVSWVSEMDVRVSVMTSSGWD